MKHQKVEQYIEDDLTSLPSTRGEAIRLNQTKYFTGQPCKNGHVAVRYTHSGCSVCRNDICAKSYRSKPHNQAKARRESRKWYQQNTERQKEHSARRRKENLAAVLAECATRRAQKLQAVPPWITLTEVNSYLKVLYETAARLKEETGTDYQIDHIIPLQSDQVCGLHAPENLRVITAEENGKKKNKLLSEYS